MNSSVQTSLIEYPCDFPIKIIGRVISLPDSLPQSLPADPIACGRDTSFSSPTLSGSTAALLEHRRQEFTQAILMIVKRHAPDFDEATLEVRISNKNTYLSLTCTIRAISRTQLDSLYQELCDHPMVVMVL
jgi:uncharacterized protein